MDITFPDATATLLSLSDGTASLYYSSGGGIIGGGGHDTVRRAAIAFVAAANQHFQSLTKVTTFPLPESGSICFHVLTDSGVHSGEASDDALSEQRHPLSPLFYAAQHVITELRKIDEAKR